jgi:flagellar basal-body rod protein FlgF
MDKLIYTAMSGATQTMNRQAAVAHNLANISTDGYRAEEHRLRAVQINAQGATRHTSLPTRAFAVDASTYTDFSQGPMHATGRTLDIAVKGNAFMAVTAADGSEAYTRAGSLEIDSDGVLRTSRGLAVQGDGGPITIPPDNRIQIGEDGTISVIPETGSPAIVNAIGRIKLVEPATSDLVRGTDGLFRMADNSAAPVSDTARLVSGFVEGSNVNPVEQMVAMISLARQFDMQIKMIQSADANDRAGTQILSPR